MPIPDRLKDPVLRASPSMYAVCVPVRLLLGLFFVCSAPSRHKGIALASLATAIVAGFLYKQHVNPRSWKNYLRVIAVYVLIALIAVYGLHTRNLALLRFCGLLIIVDALMGQQSRYIASTYMGADAPMGLAF